MMKDEALMTNLQIDGNTSTWMGHVWYRYLEVGSVIILGVKRAFVDRDQTMGSTDKSDFTVTGSTSRFPTATIKINMPACHSRLAHTHNTQSS